MTFNAYFRLIGSIYLKNTRDNARTLMKNFLEKGVALELLFSASTDTHSLKPKLLSFINKLANSQVIDYIKEIIDRSKESEFALLYDFIRHPNSASLRERLCREEVLVMRPALTRSGVESQSSALKWNMILKQACRYCPYYVQDLGKFHAFFDSFYKYREEPITLNNVHLAELKENDMKIIRYFVCANKKDTLFRDIYVESFLMERCYNFEARIGPVISFLSEPNDFKRYLDSIKKMVDKVSQGPAGPDERVSDPDLARFFVSKVTVALIDRCTLPPELLNYLIDFLTYVAAPLQKGKNGRPEDLVCLLQLALVVLVKLPLPSNEQRTKDFLTRYLKICWEQIGTSSEPNAAVGSYSKVIISFMNMRYEIFKILGQDKCAVQFYDYLLNLSIDEGQDEDNTNVWLESIRNVISSFSGANPDWIARFVSIYDTARRSNAQTQMTAQNRFWKAMILCRDNLREQFINIFAKRFFDDPNIHNHVVFDLLLILLVIAVQDNKVEELRAKVFYVKDGVSQTQVVLERLIGILRMEQDPSKNFTEKFYGLIMLYLKFFDRYEMPFEVTKPMIDDLLKSVKYDEVKQEPNNALIRVLRTQTNFMTLIYMMLQKVQQNERRGPRSGEADELVTRVIGYLSSNKIIHNIQYFMYRPQLFPALFNLVRLCVEKTKHFEVLFARANEIMRESIERRDFYRTNLGLLIYNFVLEKVEKDLSMKVIGFDALVDRMIDHLTKKKTKVRSYSLTFDELFPHDITAKLKEHPVQSYFKFFILVMLKMLALSFKVSQSEQDFKLFVNGVEQASRKLNNPDFDIKYQIFLLIKAIISPEEVAHIPSLKIFAIHNLSFERQLRLISAAFMDNSYCIKESMNDNFKIMFDEYYGIVLRFLRKFRHAEKLPEFCKAVVQPNFMLFDEKMKQSFVYEIDGVVGDTLFDRLQFFFRNQDSIMVGPRAVSRSGELSVGVMKPDRTDNYEAFAGVVIFFLRSKEFHRSTFKVTLKINGQRFECSQELLSAFIALQEVEGSENYFSVRLLKQLLVSQFSALTRERQEEFIVNFVEFLVTQQNLSSAEYQIYLELLFALSPQATQSELLAATAARNVRLLKILNLYELNERRSGRLAIPKTNGHAFSHDRLQMIQSSNYRLLSELTR